MSDSNLEVLSLLRHYERDSHVERLQHKNAIGRAFKPGSSLRVVYSRLWQDHTWLNNHQPPMVALAHLVDSYWCLPERPDLAYNSLWSSINSVYSKIAYSDCMRRGVATMPGDADSIGIALGQIQEKLEDEFSHAESVYVIGDLIDEYVKRIPEQTFHFVATYILRGIVLENHGFDKIHFTSQFKTFRTNFTDIYKKIKTSFGAGYSEVYTPVLTQDGVIFANTDDEKQKSRGITHELALVLKELAMNRNATIQHENELLSLNEKEHLEFVFKSILYSIRNNTFHGSSTARLSSLNANSRYLATSTFIYLYGHMFLTLLMYVSECIEIGEMALNMDNLYMWDSYCSKSS